MNPYKVLHIDPDAEKQDIIRAVTLAMRERKYSSREIATAQKKLMEPVSRATEEFICFIDVKSFLDQLKPALPDTKEQMASASDTDLTYLSIL